jgi:hypothetical protein
MSEKFPESFGYDESLYNEYLKRVSVLRMKIASYDDNSWLELENDIVNKADKLTQTYGKDRDKYALWHVLGGSSISPSLIDSIIADDFPGEDSVAKFVEELEGKFAGE